jgi:hypothetical protein
MRGGRALGWLSSKYVLLSRFRLPLNHSDVPRSLLPKEALLAAVPCLVALLGCQVLMMCYKSRLVGPCVYHSSDQGCQVRAQERPRRQAQFECWPGPAPPPCREGAAGPASRTALPLRPEPTHASTGLSRSRAWPTSNVIVSFGRDRDLLYIPAVVRGALVRGHLRRAAAGAARGGRVALAAALHARGPGATAAGVM